MAKRGFIIFVICCFLIIAIGTVLWIKEPKTILYFFNYRGAGGEYYAKGWQIVVMGGVMLMFGTLVAINRFRRDKKEKTID